MKTQRHYANGTEPISLFLIRRRVRHFFCDDGFGVADHIAVPVEDGVFKRHIGIENEDSWKSP